MTVYYGYELETTVEINHGVSEDRGDMATFLLDDLETIQGDFICLTTGKVEAGTKDFALDAVRSGDWVDGSKTTVTY